MEAPLSADDEKRKARNLRAKAWREKNREKARENVRRSYARHAEATRKAKKEYRDSPAGVETLRKQRERNKEVDAKRHHDWYEANQERLKAQHRDYYHERIKNVCPWIRYPSSAKERGLLWLISEEQAEAIMRQPCHYCGRAGTPFVGIDRKDNSDHYVLENCLPACKGCITAKRAMPYDEFVARIGGVAVQRKDE